MIHGYKLYSQFDAKFSRSGDIYSQYGARFVRLQKYPQDNLPSPSMLFSLAFKPPGLNHIKFIFQLAQDFLRMQVEITMLTQRQ